MTYFVTITAEQGRRLRSVIPDVLRECDRSSRNTVHRLMKEVEGTNWDWVDKLPWRQLVLQAGEAEWLESISSEFDLGIHVTGIKK